VQAKVGQLIPTSHFRGRAVTWAIDTPAMSILGIGRWRDGITGIALVAIGLSIGVAACSSSGDFSAATDTSAPAASSTPATSSSAAPAVKPAVCANVKGAQVMADGMVMAPVPTGAPAPADQRAAQALVASVRAGVAKYSTLSAAVAAGYVPATNPRGYVVHYANWSVVEAGDVLDPNRPSSLVYANTKSGPLLIGVMFLGPGPCQPGPDVAGSLTQWHAHANLCLSETHEVVGRSDPSGACTVGTHKTNTYFMMHVWTAPSLAASYQFAAHPPKDAYAAIIRTGKP
jgi:hypothetical protein